jgi:hypothetical protein
VVSCHLPKAIHSRQEIDQSKALSLVFIRAEIRILTERDTDARRKPTRVATSGGNEYWNKSSSLNHTDAFGNDLNIEN